MNTITATGSIINRKIKPIRYAVRKAGFLCWYWVVESDFGQASNGPFLTRRGAVRDLSAITGKTDLNLSGPE